MRVTDHQEFADWVKEVIKKNNLSLRQAEIKTGMAYSTIKNLMDGRSTTASIVIEFAGALGEDVEYALRLSGNENVAKYWAKAKKQPQEQSEEQGWATIEIGDTVTAYDAHGREIPASKQDIADLQERLGAMEEMLRQALEKAK